MSVTRTDQVKAEAVCTDMPGLDYDDGGESWRTRVNHIAAALAAERQAARAPLLDLADELDCDADSADSIAQGWAAVGSAADHARCVALADDRRETAERIRRTAEGDTP